MAKGQKRPKAYHHGDLRAALLCAAIELVQEHGARGLSLRECARRAGVSHAAPYRHFPDKESLLSAIAQEGFEGLWRAGIEAMEALDDPYERLVAYGVAYVRFAVEHPAHHRVMFGAELGAPSKPPSLDGPGSKAFDLLVDAAAAVVGPDADPLEAAIAAWSLPHGLSMLILDGRIPAEHVSSPQTAEAFARQIYRVWAGALRPPPERR